MQRVYTFAALREARTKLQNRRGNYITANLYAQRISRELLRAIMQCSFHHISHLTDATSGDARPRFVIGARTGRQTGTDGQTRSHRHIHADQWFRLACIKILAPDCHIDGCGPIPEQFHLQYLLRMQLQSRGNGCLLSTTIPSVGDTSIRQTDPNLALLMLFYWR